MSEISDPMPITYDLRLYSRRAAIEVFLHTLSYHRVGANFLVTALSRSKAAPKTVLDVGCGEGTFTSGLLREMQDNHLVLPETIIAIDPDLENLEAYKSKLKTYNGVAVSTVASTLEDAVIEGSYDLIICSHSLYGTLENPHLSEARKLRHVTELLRGLKSGGLSFWSLASRKSAAYKVKSEILRTLDLANLSVHGEELQDYITKAGALSKGTLHESYMDVTHLIGDEAAMAKWVSYFARAAEERIESLGIDTVREIIKTHALTFSDIDHKTWSQMCKFPADIGKPTKHSLLLPHSEIFFVVPNPF